MSDPQNEEQWVSRAMSAERGLSAVREREARLRDSLRALPDEPMPAHLLGHGVPSVRDWLRERLGALLTEDGTDDGDPDQQPGLMNTADEPDADEDDEQALSVPDDGLRDALRALCNDPAGDGFGGTHIRVRAIRALLTEDGTE